MRYMTKQEILRSYLEYVIDNLDVDPEEGAKLYLFENELVLWERNDMERYVQHPFVDIIRDMFCYDPYDIENYHWLTIKRMIKDVFDARYGRNIE